MQVSASGAEADAVTTASSGGNVVARPMGDPLVTTASAAAPEQVQK